MKEEKLRILVSGIKYEQNQFTRAVEKYGCTAYHVDGDPGTFPRFADAAIIMIGVSSHSKYHSIKDDYKKQGKPIFVAGHGFSEIKESFEKFLQEKRGWIYPPVIAEASGLKVPQTWIESPQTLEAEKVDMQVSNEKRKYSYSDEELSTIFSVITEGRTKKLKTAEIAVHLNKSGIKKITGKPFGGTDVQNFSQKFKIKASKLPALKTVAPVKEKVAETSSKDPLDLITKVTTSALNDHDKLILITKISKGEITKEEYVESLVVENDLYLEQVNICRTKNQNPNVTLSKAQAELVLANLSTIHKFIEGTLV